MPTKKKKKHSVQKIADDLEKLGDTLTTGSGKNKYVKRKKKREGPLKQQVRGATVSQPDKPTKKKKKKTKTIRKTKDGKIKKTTPLGSSKIKTKLHAKQKDAPVGHKQGAKKFGRPVGPPKDIPDTKALVKKDNKLVGKKPKSKALTVRGERGLKKQSTALQNTRTRPRVEIDVTPRGTPLPEGKGKKRKSKKTEQLGRGKQKLLREGKKKPKGRGVKKKFLKWLGIGGAATGAALYGAGKSGQTKIKKENQALYEQNKKIDRDRKTRDLLRKIEKAGRKRYRRKPPRMRSPGREARLRDAEVARTRAALVMGHPTKKAKKRGKKK